MAVSRMDVNVIIMTPFTAFGCHVSVVGLVFERRLSVITHAMTGCQWLPVAAVGCQLLSVAVRGYKQLPTVIHLRQVAVSCCHWPSARLQVHTVQCRCALLYTDVPFLMQVRLDTAYVTCFYLIQMHAVHGRCTTGFASRYHSDPLSDVDRRCLFTHRCPLIRYHTE